MVVFRLVISLMEPYTIDMNGYLAWSRHLAENGPADLYSRFHVVYAPFYLYFLWITGFIAKFLSLPVYAHIYLIKLWSVLFEFLGALIIFRMAERANRRGFGKLAASFYILNPGVLFNSSVWGQFDSIPATMLLAVVYLFELGSAMRQRPSWFRCSLNPKAVFSPPWFCTCISRASKLTGKASEE